MLCLDYLGLLNTDRQRPGPVQMFLQGRESRVRYVLDRLPAWMGDLVEQVPEHMEERRALSGTNLALCNQETREALYRVLSRTVTIATITTRRSIPLQSR